MPTRRSTAPTHIRTPETVLVLFGVSLSVRQFLLLLVGLALSFQLWQPLGVLELLPGGLVLRWILTVVPLGVALALAFVFPRARSLEAWGLVLLRYWLRPHCLVWRSIRWTDPGFAVEEEEGDGIP